MTRNANISDLLDIPLEPIDDLLALASSRGRPQTAAPLTLAYSRDVTQGDLIALLADGPSSSPTGIIQRLRAPHHSIARMLAEGRKAVEIAAVMGYSQSRISILQDSPAFQELVEYYKGQVTEQYLDMHNRLATLGATATEELQERLEDTPETFSNRELRELVESTMDRSVAPAKGGPKGPAQGASPVSISVNFVSGNNARPGDQAPVIEARATPVSLLKQGE